MAKLAKRLSCVLNNYLHGVFDCKHTVKISWVYAYLAQLPSPGTAFFRSTSITETAVSRLRQILITEGPYKLMKTDAVYFTLKLFMFSRYWLVGPVWKQIDQKDKVAWKLLMSKTGKQGIAIHRFLNISRSKGNQTVKFVNLLEHNMRKFSLEKSYTGCYRTSIPFLKKFASYWKDCHFSITKVWHPDKRKNNRKNNKIRNSIFDNS